MRDAPALKTDFPTRDPGLAEAASLVASGLRRPAMPPLVLDMIAKGLDWVAVALALWFANFAVVHPDVAVSSSALMAIASATVTVTLLGFWGLHRQPVLGKPASACLGAIGIAVMVALFGSMLGYWPEPDLPYLSALAVSLAVFLTPGRILLWGIARLVLDYGLMERRAVLVGGGPNAASLIRGLSRNPDNDIRICGIFDDRDEIRSPSVIVGVPKIGRIEELLDFARSAEIDMIIITLPLGAEERIREILSMATVLPLDVRLSAFSSDYEFPRRVNEAQVEGGLIDVARRPMNGEVRLSKRVVDSVLVLPVLLLVSPIMLMAALAIRIESKGPVFFKQYRYGYNHKPIEVLKFRSMYAEQCDGAARQIVVRDDPRVTRVGRFIRKWSIDELPQLFNVLRGDLSLVGPRPHALDAVSSRQMAFEEIVDGYAARHKVPPGVTGWAQIHGWRGEIDEPEKLLKRVEHDLYYIENRSFWMDLKIILRTPLCLLNTRNAY